MCLGYAVFPGARTSSCALGTQCSQVHVPRRVPGYAVFPGARTSSCALGTQCSQVHVPRRVPGYTAS